MGVVKKVKVKVPKGTRDFNESEMALRNMIFEKVKSIFTKHGAVTIDTPVFELKEILAGKYGEDSKLIYDLQDQGGELCSLRYDLTVPFARYCAMNKVDSIKRYQIAKVYRRDNISINKGRMREFYQCDFDIAGTYDVMIPDSQCLAVLVEILESLELGDFTVKLNHRQVLDGMFEYCGVPEDKIRAISSAVDKLDKMSWVDVKKEMVDEKGLVEAIADKIGEFVGYKGGVELIDTLMSTPLAQNEKARKGIDEMKILFEYLGYLGIQDRISFDLSLARGLDYYTGVIYEAVFNSTADETSGIGSIAAGGRYDSLVGMFSSNAVPCVGVSIGIERVYAILSKRETKVKSVSTQVYVTAVDGQLKERFLIAKELWDAGISADFMYKTKPKIRNQLSGCEKLGIPLSVIIGQNEVDQGIVKIKNFATTEEVVVKRSEMVDKIKELLQ